jgi:hypothetical protein
MYIFFSPDREIVKEVLEFAQKEFPNDKFFLIHNLNISIIKIQRSNPKLVLTSKEIIQENIIRLALDYFAKGLTYSKKETEPIYNAYLCMDTCPYNIGYCKKYMESLTNDSIMCNMKIRCKKCVDHYGFDN